MNESARDTLVLSAVRIRAEFALDLGSVAKRMAAELALQNLCLLLMDCHHELAEKEMVNLKRLLTL
jgi:hypothetical protein